MIPTLESQREELKHRIWAQQDKISRRTIMRREGITSEELDELYGEIVQEHCGEASRKIVGGNHYKEIDWSKEIEVRHYV